MKLEKIAVKVSSDFECQFIKDKFNFKRHDYSWQSYPYLFLWEDNAGNDIYKTNNKDEVIFLTFQEWLIKENIKIETNNKTMRELILNVVNKTYDNINLRRTTVPLFMSNPGIGKSQIIKEFAESKKVKFKKITLSTRMPNEVVGGLMPNPKTKLWEYFDSEELYNLKDGDILFFDEVFNGTLKQTLDAFLNFIEDRILPSGKPLADVLIIGASNPQGLINLTPQIKERFIRYDLTFNNTEFQEYLKEKYGIPFDISKNLCTLVNKEKFESTIWNYLTPRSIEKAINQIACDLKSPYDDELLPILKTKIPVPMDLVALNVKKDEEVEFLELLKLIIQKQNNKTDVNKNQKQESRATADILS
jgi:hypothetical protein